MLLTCPRLHIRGLSPSVGAPAQGSREEVLFLDLVAVVVAGGAVFGGSGVDGGGLVGGGALDVGLLGAHGLARGP